MLRNRLISALVLIPIVITILFFLPLTGFAIAMLVMCTLAAWEWGQLSCFNPFKQKIWLVLLCSLLIAITFFILPQYNYNLRQSIIISTLWASLIWWIVALLLVIFYPSSAVIWRGSTLLRVVFGLFTIVPFFGGTLLLRVWHYNSNHCSGALWLLYVMTLIWGTDSGAYMFGKTFGKHKLASKVSPSKTWQGLIGGLLTTVILSWVYSILINLEVSSTTLLICSIFISLASSLGDLTESMFKREAGTKDSGNLIPGHGGVLDCIDSTTAAVPVSAYLLFLVFEII